MASGGSGQQFRRETDRQEYDFEDYKDSKRFQEMMTGPDVELQAQLPTDQVTLKYPKRGPIRESEFQCIRLWRSGHNQYLTFYANKSSPGIYREYPMRHLKKGKNKSKSVVLEVDIPKSPSRQESSVRRPQLAHNTSDQSIEQGLTRTIDIENLRDMQEMTIVFTKATDQVVFLQQANFNGIIRDPVLPPLSFQSERPGG